MITIKINILYILLTDLVHIYNKLIKNNIRVIIYYQSINYCNLSKLFFKSVIFYQSATDN